MTKSRLRVRVYSLCVGLACALPCMFAHAEARFDLIGPRIDIRVTRGDRTLPISDVPNLQAGDKIWLHPNLPPSQSVHLLLILAFLRGTTNPPPESWFTRIETWNRGVVQEGVFVTVPEEAQQAILFLAPETGGDFGTLRKAVQGRPGVFVRASQDLISAGFEQARIEKYVNSMHQIPNADPTTLLDHSNLLARTLNLRPNSDCFKLPIDMQYNCLVQSGNQSLLDDSHAQDVIARLSNGPSSDFINQASYTQAFGAGVYSAYVGAAVDLFRILGNLHTAQYQYIPAISFPDQESLNLHLNTAPSFVNPKSVIVIGLPPINKDVLPPLRQPDPNFVACLANPGVVFPVEGAPLVFSTSYAHDLVLHLNIPAGSSADHPARTVDIPLLPNAYQGGFIVDRAVERKRLPLPTVPEITETNPEPPTVPAAAQPSSTVTSPASGDITGTITGSWGFDSFTGPTMQLQSIPGRNWTLAASNAIIAGHDNHVMLASTGNACVESVHVEIQPGTYIPAQWKADEHASLINVHLPNLSGPGALRIAVHQYGQSNTAFVTARTFAEPAALTALTLHAGDNYAIVTGSNLGQVQQLTVGDFTFTPVPTPPDETATPNTLRLTLPASAPPPRLRAGDALNASFILKDGRNIILPVTIAPMRPVVALLSRNMGRPANAAIKLGSEDDLPASQQLTFSLKSSAPFPRAGKIEITNSDDTLHTEFTVASGTLILQDRHTLVGTFNPLKTFGPSAFGPLRLRAVAPDGTAGDWLPLVNLVRLPDLIGISCPSDATLPCTLIGSDLYLLQTLSPDPDFASPVTIPEGFVATTLAIPRPIPVSSTKPPSTQLYLHLRDDPTSTSSITIPIAMAPKSAASKTAASRTAASVSPAPAVPPPSSGPSDSATLPAPPAGGTPNRP